MAPTSQPRPDTATELLKTSQEGNPDTDGGEDTDDEIEVPPHLDQLEQLDGEIRRFRNVALADLELEISGLEVNRKPQAAFFKKNYIERVNTRIAFDHAEEKEILNQLWVLFDELQWTLAYERQQSPGGSNEADPNPLPPSWKPCVAINLYNVLLSERFHLEYDLYYYGTKLEKHPDVNERPLLHPPDLTALRKGFKITRSRLQTFCQMMENMRLELAAATSTGGGQDNETGAARDTICKVLKEEINKKYPIVAVPDIGGPLAPEDYPMG